MGWLRQNTHLLANFGQVTLWAAGVLTTYALAEKIMARAKQTYGGNLDVAIRMPHVPDMIQLYAMSTDQQTRGMPALDLVQSGGPLFQSPSCSNGSPLSGLDGLSALNRIGGGVASGASPVVIQLDGPATVSLLLTPGLITA
ncbi:MAG: hypothetical protein LC114_21995 [Bryobacterales bacterium]|nr:hypothetical protein [Bryobacterales bacterium]